jgi:hypothetical protein
MFYVQLVVNWHCAIFLHARVAFFVIFTVLNSWTYWFADIIERFHITAFLLFVLAQNILEAEGPWFDSFLIVSSIFLCQYGSKVILLIFCSECLLDIYYLFFVQNASLVFMCEVLIDAIKHSFLAKFNEIKPVAYSEFLEDLSKQVCSDN